MLGLHHRLLFEPVSLRHTGIREKEPELGGRAAPCAGTRGRRRPTAWPADGSAQKNFCFCGNFIEQFVVRRDALRRPIGKHAQRRTIRTSRTASMPVRTGTRPRPAEDPRSYALTR